MPEDQGQSPEHETLPGGDRQFAETMCRFINDQIHQTIDDSFREAIRAARLSIIATGAGAVLTAIGSALLLLGIFRRLEELLVPEWMPYAVAGGLGVIVGVVLCVVGRPRRRSNGSGE